jgi:hypothetical protein
LVISTALVAQLLQPLLEGHHLCHQASSGVIRRHQASTQASTQAGTQTRPIRGYDH